MIYVIWGTGSFASKHCQAVFAEYDIDFFCDNDEKKWGEQFFGKRIEPGNKLFEYSPDAVTVIILSDLYYREISVQLSEMGISNIGFLKDERFVFLPFYDEECFIKGENYIHYPYCKANKHTIKKVLFVAWGLNYKRPHSYAAALKHHGILSYYAYENKEFGNFTQELANHMFEETIQIRDVLSFYNHVKESDYDLVHVMMPAYALFLKSTGKTVIMELIDYYSLMEISNPLTNRRSIAIENAALSLADGVVFLNEPIRRFVTNKNKMPEKRALTFPFYISSDYIPICRKDGYECEETHCVFVGQLGLNLDHRDYTNLFCKFEQARVHIHIYAYGPPETLSYYETLAKDSGFIHFNMEVSYGELLTELTRFDIGIATYCFTPGDDLFLRTSFSGKVFDYLMAGLPVAVCDTEILSEFVDKLSCGKVVDFNGDLKKQLEDIKNIRIDKDFCISNGLIMEKNIGRLIDFYSEVVIC